MSLRQILNSWFNEWLDRTNQDLSALTEDDWKAIANKTGQSEEWGTYRYRENLPETYNLSTPTIDRTVQPDKRTPSNQ